MKKTLVIAAALVTLGMPAFALDCTEDLPKLEAAIAESTADAAKVEEAKSLLTEAKNNHAAGNHENCAENLAAAMAVLGVSE